jgi:hypothetical protein
VVGVRFAILDCSRLHTVCFSMHCSGSEVCLRAVQFQHTLQQSAEARRLGVGADTEAADDAWLRALLSIVGELCSCSRALAVFTLLQDSCTLQLRHQLCSVLTVYVPHSAHPSHAAWALDHNLHHPG